MFLRLYKNENDRLDWHYDNNFTKGLRYTLVIPLYVDDCNTSHFMIKDRKTGFEQVIPVNVGEGVLYNGSDVYHKISPQTKGCKRLVLIIPFYEDYSMSFIGKCRHHARSFIYQFLTL